MATLKEKGRNIFESATGNVGSVGGGNASSVEAMGEFVKKFKLWIRIQNDDDLRPLIESPEKIAKVETRLGERELSGTDDGLIAKVRGVLGLSERKEQNGNSDDQLEKLVEGMLGNATNTEQKEMWEQVRLLENGENLDPAKVDEVGQFLGNLSELVNEKVGMGDLDHEGIVRLVDRVERLSVLAEIAEVASRNDVNQDKTAVSKLKLKRMDLLGKPGEKLFRPRKGNRGNREKIDKLIVEFENAADRAETKKKLSEQSVDDLQQGYLVANEMEDDIFEMVDNSVGNEDLFRMKIATRMVQETYLAQIATKWGDDLGLSDDELPALTVALRKQLERKYKYWLSSKVDDVDWGELKVATNNEFQRLTRKRGKTKSEARSPQEAILKELENRRNNEYGDLGMWGGRPKDREWSGRMLGLLDEGKLGEAMSMMMEYTTRVGVRESRQDLTFMGLQREFMDHLTRKSPDLAAMYELMGEMAWTPNIATLDFDKYAEIAKSIFGNKANIELLRGSFVMAAGNKARFGDREVVLNSSIFADWLLEPRNLFKLMGATPNSTDTALRNILIEKMFGEGARQATKKIDGKEKFVLALPGVDEKDWKELGNVSMDVAFAKLGEVGFEGWGSEGEMKLNEWLDRNMWIMKNGMGLMWFEGEWMHNKELMAYQKQLLESGSKSLLTSLVGRAAYMEHFNNMASPLAESSEAVLGVLGPMSIYKADSIRVAAMRQELVGRGVSPEKAQEIAEWLPNLSVRWRILEREGHKMKFFDRLRDPRMARYAFNDLSVESGEVRGLVVRELEEMGMKGIPTGDEIWAMYQEYQKIKGKPYDGKVKLSETEEKRRNKVMVFGSRYEAVWNEIEEMKFAEKKDWWKGLGKDELVALFAINQKYKRGIDIQLPENEKYKKQLESQSLESLKVMFVGEAHAGAFLNRAKTAQGDDYKEYYGKYLPAYKKMVELILGKYSTGLMLKKDMAEIDGELAKFLPQSERQKIWTLLWHDFGRMHDYQLVGPNVIPLTKSRKHAIDYPWWQPWKKSEHEHDYAAHEIVTPTYKDESGGVWYGVDINGSRVTEVEDYKGNYAREVLHIDYVRPSDIEDSLNYLQMLGVMDEHTKHRMAERILGKKKEVRTVIGGMGKKLGMSDAAVDRMVESLGGNISKTWTWMVTHLPFFDDPKYALFSLLHEVTGMGAKTFSYIFDFDLFGGGGAKHH